MRPLLRYWIVQVHEVKDEEAYGKYVGKYVESFVRCRPGATPTVHCPKP